MPGNPINNPSTSEPIRLLTADPSVVRTEPESPAPPNNSLVGVSPIRQLAEIPHDELAHLAEEFGLDARRHRLRQDLVAALHERRQLIASFDRDAMLDVIRWSRRPVTINATKEQIAQEIARLTTMKFSGLSHRGLFVLARMRGLDVIESDDVPSIVIKLARQEGFFKRLNRKRRAVLGAIVANIVGENPSAADYQFLPPSGEAPTPNAQSARSTNIKQDIEEGGLFSGISNRIKKTADQYLNQKLDEIEARIDRKLDEIDRKLGEWRDKEIANRLKIPEDHPLGQRHRWHRVADLFLHHDLLG